MAINYLSGRTWKEVFVADCKVQFQTSCGDFKEKTKNPRHLNQPPCRNWKPDLLNKIQEYYIVTIMSTCMYAMYVYMYAMYVLCVYVCTYVRTCLCPYMCVCVCMLVSQVIKGGRG
jgi:hypothetical protein